MVGLPVFGKEGSGTPVFKILASALGHYWEPSCEVILNLDQWLKRRCPLMKKLTDGRWTKTDHNISQRYIEKLAMPLVVMLYNNLIYCNTVKTLYSDILYNNKILYNVNCICTNVQV